VTNGFKKDLEIRGVGFRAILKGSNLELSLGKSHPINMVIPSEIKVEVAKDQRAVTISGIDKQKVGAFAAKIRSFYPPEPYKGKGVRYVGEYVRSKEGKSG
jgi:large subunit ribosomal protein L6